MYGYGAELPDILQEVHIPKRYPSLAIFFLIFRLTCISSHENGAFKYMGTKMKPVFVLTIMDKLFATY